MPKGKPYSSSIDNATATQLLNSSREVFGDVPLGDALAETARNLAKIVEQCNKFLRTNEFAKMVADYHAIKLGRRGRADIVVTSTGLVTLEIGYDGVPTRPLVKPTRRKLPLLKDLRADAEALGVSIEHLGIKRKEIMEFLERTRSERRGKEGRRVALVEDDPGPMSAGPDETKVHPQTDEARPPKRRGVVKNGDAVDAVDVSSMIIDETAVVAEGTNSASRRSMRQMVEQSKDVNIADLLDSKTPD